MRGRKMDIISMRIELMREDIYDVDRGEKTAEEAQRCILQHARRMVRELEHLDPIESGPIQVTFELQGAKVIRRG